MKRYHLKPGIAAMLSVRDEAEPTMVAFYMGPDPLPAQGAQARVQWEAARSGKLIDPNGLPMELVAAVNRHFGAIFSLPVERRQAYLDAVGSYDVWVDETKFLEDG